MSRFTLLVLTLSLLNNEIQCEELDENAKTPGSLLPRASINLPNNWRRLNMELPLEKKNFGNTTNRIERNLNASSNRQAKFFPKFSVVAGLDIGGGLAARSTSNLSSLAKITQANSLPGILNPYFAASYDPFPTSAMHQSIQVLYNIVENLREQVNNLTRQTNNSMHSIFSSEDLNENLVDSRNKYKQKMKIKKSTPKRKKQEKLEDNDEAAEEDEMDYIDEKPMKKVTRNGAKTNINAKQQAVPTNTSTESSMEVTDSTLTNSTQGNNTYNKPGWYYGGNPQTIDNVSFTYDRPQESYGPPSSNYGPPSSSYGAPSYNYGAPSYNYGAPSQSYGPPSNQYGPPSRGYGAPYELAHYSAFHDSEPIVFDDLSDNLFISAPSQRWQQRLPFARSQKLDSTTTSPLIANSNGFVPIL